MAIDALQHHLDWEVIGSYLPSKKVIQETFLNEKVHIKLVKVLEAIVAGLEDVESQEERTVTFKYLEKVF